MLSRPIRALGVLTGAAALAVGPLAFPASAETFEIQLIGINDFHGRLEPVGTTEGEEGFEDGLPIGGVEQLAGAVAELTAENPNTLFVSGGDNIGASTFTSNVQGDAPTIEALNEIGLVASTVGNHEFDQGFSDIENGGRIDELAAFPYLGANVYAEGTQDVLLDEYVVTEIGGVQVGFIGTVTDETASLVAPAGIEGLEFGDEAEAANRVAAQLSDGDADNGEAEVVVLLSHSGVEIQTDDPCAEVQAGPLVQGASADIDAMVQGHTHQRYACDELSGPGGFNGPVAQGGQYGEAFDVITLTYDDTAGEVVASTAEVRPLIGYPQDANAEVSEIVAEAVGFAADAGAEPLGVITTDILRARDDDGEEDRGSESVLGNFIADVQLDQTEAAGAQIAFMNPGGLRDDFEINDTFGDEACGVVTLGEANVVQPFANGVVTMTLTGAQIKSVLEEQWQPEGSGRPFLALGVSEGFYHSFDSSLPRGERVTEVTLDGEELDPAAEYRVTVNSFLASGGDNFATLAEGTDRQELGVTDLEALTAFLGEREAVTPDVEPRRSADGGGDADPLLTTGATCPAQEPSPTPPGDGGDDDGDDGDDDDGRNPGFGVDTGRTGDDGTLGAGTLGVIGGLTLLLAAGGYAVRRRTSGAAR